MECCAAIFRNALMKSLNIVIKSSVEITKYLTLVSNEILEYAFLQIYLVFSSQPMSSWSQTSNNLVTVTLSIGLSSILILVVKFSLDLVYSMKLLLFWLMSIRFLSGQPDNDFREHFILNFSAIIVCESTNRVVPHCSAIAVWVE